MYSDMDVLCGKGPLINRHQGNVFYRHYVEEQLHDYINASTKFEKYQIMDKVYQEVVKNGLFLKKNSATNKWEQLDFNKALGKISASFRILQYDQNITIPIHTPSNAPTSATLRSNHQQHSQHTHHNHTH